MPRWRLLLAAVFGLVLSLACFVIVRQVPRVGISLQRQGAVVSRALDAPVAGTVLQRGDVVLAVTALDTGDSSAVRDVDVIEEPDYLATWAERNEFFARQDLLARIAASPRVRIDAQRGDTARLNAIVAPAPVALRALPLMFWLQLLLGGIGLLVGAWIWSLRPDDWSARLYALTGLGLLLAVDAAAVYGARELALPATVFRALGEVNHLGGLLFAGALCALFLVYPRQLIAPRRAVHIVSAALGWWVINIWQLTPAPTWFGAALLVAMVVTLIATVLQWRATRGDPVDRAVLRWLGATVITSCCAISVLTTLPLLAVGAPAVSQSVGFLFVLPMYLGLAVGLRQYRLFTLDEWAFRLLFWGVAMTMVLLLDIWLIGTLGTGGAGAVAVAALLVLSTAPVRRWAWGWKHRGQAVLPVQLFRDVLGVAAAASEAERDRRWRAALAGWFAPMHSADAVTPDDVVSPAPADTDRAQLLAQGRELVVPATSASPAIRLSFASGGARLFTPDDAKLVDTARELLVISDESRAALAEGMRLERVRIARDLHDTVSSPLLAGLRPLANASPGEAQMHAMQSDIRRAVDGMRSVVAGPLRGGIRLSELLADVRFASITRLDAAGLAAEWPVPSPAYDADLSAEQRHALTAFTQECITNVIRHAQATGVSVSVELSPVRELTMTIADDGRGFDPARVTRGDGLGNLQARARSLGGSVSVRRRAMPAHGTEILLTTAPLALVGD